MNIKPNRSYYKDPELLKKIGSKIRDIRLSKNISQVSLAFECELDYSQINRMELGKVNFSISILSKVAEGLKVDLIDLFK